MKVSEKVVEINVNHILNIGIDVASRKLDIHFECPIKVNSREVYRDQIANRSDIIASSLEKYRSLAQEKGYQNIRIVCEPTGPYSINLLNVAQSLNCFTAYANPESVAKSKVIETNECGKTDPIDAEIINNLAERNKVLTHRTYSKEYANLRVLNSHYEDLDRSYVSARNQVHKTLKMLFPDFSMKVDTVFSKTGQTLYKFYGFSPWRITAQGFKHFNNKLRLNAKGVRNSTIQKIWDDAIATCKYNCSDIAWSLSERLGDHYEDYLRYKDRKDRLKKQMITILKEIRKEEPTIAKASTNFVSEFHVARLLAETGPLSDFNTHKELLNYIGMNLRERKSGFYTGKTKLSKKGRPVARKVLSQIVLPLVHRKRLYGPAYHSIKKRTGKPGTLLMTNFMRKFLKSFFGIYKSKSEFDENRLFIDAGAYNKLFKSA